MAVSIFQCPVYRSLKSKRTVPRDGASYTGSDNRWGGTFGSRGGLRGWNVSRGAVPTTVVQGRFLWYGGFPFLPNPVLMNYTHAAAILIVVFLHSFCFTTGTFYIAIYFQVRF